VGGTQFAEDGGQYWSSNNSTGGGSALSYIPETVWNESRTSDPASGGGGASVVFGKPVWQTGLGVPADSARDVPDVALSSASGHVGYLVYNGGSLVVFGGTSAASPAFAGIATLLNQYLLQNGALSTPGLGNMNPRLYSLAQSSPGVFHDITTGSNIVTITCGSRSRNCVAGSYGYNAGTGYDQASGLGSVDAHALVMAWASGLPTPALSGPPLIAGVANAASYRQQFAPGMVVSIFGSSLARGTVIAGSVPLPTVSLGVSVTVNGIAAPLYYVSPGQINLQIPYETAAGQATLVVRNNGETSSTSLTIGSAAPGLFTDASGALVPAGSALRGQVISLYFTGAGAVSPAVATGAAPAVGTAIAKLPAPAQATSVTVGGVPAAISFAGIPSGLVGVMQVNFTVPSNAPRGSQKVVVTVNGVPSQSATLLVN
jgi:uncharacterized protein (TIGR03437 family)